MVAIGLAAYAVWCFLRAVLDADRKGSDGRGLAKRAVTFGKGVVYAALVVAVVGMMRGTGGRGDDAGVRDWTARLMSFPLGIWLVGLTGVAVVVFGLRQLYCAKAADVDEPLDLGQMGVTAHHWARQFSRFGLAARGVVFAVVGVFLVTAARHENPAEARGVGGALHALQERSYGSALLAAVALGLIAYGCYQFVLVRYRRFDPT